MVVIVSWRVDNIAPTPNGHSKRNQTYTAIAKSARIVASVPALISSAPTVGPTTSVRRYSTLVPSLSFDLLDRQLLLLVAAGLALQADEHITRPAEIL